jgi:hypothetical protein
LFFGCSGPSPNVPVESKLDNLPVPAPTWIPLKMPQSQVTLPAFLAGTQQQLSSGCWKPAEVTAGQGPGDIHWDETKQHQLDADFKATFSAYLVKANVDASVLSALKQTWKLDLTDVSYAAVDPSKIRPDFSNEACTATELNWFKDGSFVVTEGVKAHSAKLSASLSMNDQQRAKLDAAIAAINTEFHTNFQNSNVNGENLDITASDAYIGAMGTGLVAKRCALKVPVEVQPNTSFTMCDGLYTVRIIPSGTGARYTLAVTPRDAATGEFDAAFNRQEMYQLGSLRIVLALISQQAQTFRVDNLSVLLVGAGA